MQNIKKSALKTLASLTLMMAAGLIASTGASAQTLREAVQIAVDTNPDITEAAANRRAIDRELDQAYSRFYPTLDLEAGYGPEFSNNPSTRARPGAILDGDPNGRWLNRAEASMIATETLFEGFGREGQLNRERARVNSAAWRLRARSEALALDVVNAYLDVLRHERILDLSDANIAVHRDIVGDVRDRVDSGQSGIGDLQQAEARLASALTARVSTLSDLDIARIRYLRHVGAQPGSLSQPTFDERVLPGDEAGAVQMSRERSPIIQLAQADVKAARAAIEIQRSSMWPEVGVELRGDLRENISGLVGSNHQFSAMLRMKYNLYRGGADEYAVQEARERTSEAQSAVMRLARDVEEEVRTSWSLKVRQDMEVTERTAQVASNQQVVATYRDEFGVGRRPLLDLLDSENELFNSSSRLVTSEQSAQFARYRVLGAMGRLTWYMGSTLPDEGTPNQ